MDQDLKARLLQLQILIETGEKYEAELLSPLPDESKNALIENRHQLTRLVSEFHAIDALLSKDTEGGRSFDSLKEQYQTIKALLDDPRPLAASQQALGERASCWTPCTTCISCTQCVTSTFLRPPNEHFCYPAASRESICNPKSDTVGQYEHGRLDPYLVKWDEEN